MSYYKLHPNGQGQVKSHCESIDKGKPQLDCLTSLTGRFLLRPTKAFPKAKTKQDIKHGLDTGLLWMSPNKETDESWGKIVTSVSTGSVAGVLYLQTLRHTTLILNQGSAMLFL